MLVIKNLSLVLALVLAQGLAAQAVLNGEYFIKDDPGFGQGTPVSFVSGDTISGSFVLDVTSLSPGFHSVFMRLRDENGQWGYLHRQLIFVDQEGVTPTPQNHVVTSGEYFVDTDPGFGQGTPVSFVSGDTISGSFAVDVTSLSPGFHSVFMRLRDENGQWGYLHRQLIFVDQEGVTPTPQNHVVTSGEYFVDTDPGFGKGTPVSFASGDTISGSFVLDVTNMSPGFHSVFLRLRDENGQWGYLHRQLIFVDEEGVTPEPEDQEVVAAEFFVDIDPGLGMGTPISIQQPGDTLNVSDLPIQIIQCLNPGVHRLYVRCKASNGQWGFLQSTAFTIEIPNASVASIMHQPVPECGVRNAEVFEVIVHNDGTAPIAPGVIQVVLEVTGANPGMFGPFFASDTIPVGENGVIQATNIDLSQPGANAIKAALVTCENQPLGEGVAVQVIGEGGILPTVDPIANRSVCVGPLTTPIMFTGNTQNATYSWTNNQPSIGLPASGTGGLPAFQPQLSGNDPVTATITVIPLDGACQGNPIYFTTSVEIGVQASISGFQSFCEGGSTTLTAGGGTSYAWSTGETSSELVVDAAGTYTVTVTDANGCIGTSSATVNTLPAVSISGSQSFCTGGSTTLTAGGGTSYAWSTGETSSELVVDAAGTYTATVTDANGCTGTAIATVEESTAVAVTITGPTTFCTGGSTTLTASLGTLHAWNTGETTPFISVMASGTYTVTVTGSNGCTGTSSILVTELPPTTANEQFEQQLNKLGGLVVSDTITHIDSIRFSSDGMEMIIERKDGSTMTHAIDDIVDFRYVGRPVGKIRALDCNSPSLSGFLVQGVEAGGMILKVPYICGNGNPFAEQVFHAVGTGITATLEAGEFIDGDSTLTLILDGVSCEAGPVVFSLVVGGQQCELELEVNEGEPFALRSFFSESVIPSGIDPMFWYVGPDTLTELKYYVNGMEVVSTENYELITNPGVDFSIHATALQAGVCPVQSDTLHFQVKELKRAGNGYFHPEGAFSLEEVWVYSSLDSAMLDNSRTFQLELSTMMGKDLIYAIKPAAEVERQLVALHFSDGTEGLVDLTNTNTAIALVAMLPDIVSHEKKDPSLIRDIIQFSGGFDQLVLEISTQLRDSGWIDLTQNNLVSLVKSISDEVLMQLQPQQRSNWECTLVNAPFLSIKGEVYEDWGKAVKFSHCGINHTYFAQLYSHEGKPLRSDPVAMFLGDGHNPSDKLFSDFIANIVVQVPNLRKLRRMRINPKLDDKLSARELFSSSSSFNEPFSEFRIRLTNGWGLNENETDDVAEAYNDFVFLSSYISALTGSRSLGPLNCINSIAEIIATSYDLTVKRKFFDSPTAAVTGIYDLTTSWLSVVSDCGIRPISRWLTSYIGAVGFVKESGFMVQFLYDRHTQLPRINYVFSKVDDRIRGKLELESNEDTLFYAVPGSLANGKPMITMYEYDVYALSGGGKVLLYESRSRMDDFERQYPGFKMEVLSLNTDRFRIGNKELQGYNVLPVSKNIFRNVEGIIQIDDWKILNNKNMLPLPTTGIIGVQFTYRDKELPTYVKGYEKSGFEFEANVEPAKLSIKSGDGQVGQPNEAMRVSVELNGVPSGIPAIGCPIRFTIKKGEGKIKTINGWGYAIGQEITIPTIYWGLAAVDWILGEAQDTQVLEVSYWVGDVKIDSVEFTATIPTCDNPGQGTVCNPVTGRIWMDRNLGASRVATSSTDADAYGGYYQWGRATTEFTPAPSFPYDWSVPQNNNYWQGVNGLNNPCPAGFRIPTESEWVAEMNSWNTRNAAGAFASPLRLSMAGSRHYDSGSFITVGSFGFYWSSTVVGLYPRSLRFNAGAADAHNVLRAYGLSVRCLKD